MTAKRLGKQTITFASPPSFLGAGCTAGKKEGEGPLGRTFHTIYDDTRCGEKSWEKAESKMQKDALTHAVTKANIPIESIEYIFAGDLLNQCIGSTFGLREFGIPFIGIYGACSTMSEGLGLAAMAIDGGFASAACALTSSHYCSAERQYRLPLEYGGQRTPTAQWTVTGSGAAILGQDGPGPYVTHFTTGKIVDAGIKDAGNMGAAMAPAAADTLLAFFNESGLKPNEIDLIVTGDLGSFGRDITRDLCAKENLSLGQNYNDCGAMIFDPKKQDVHAGGSGCACSAVVLCGHILNEMRGGNIKKILFCGTGALLSPVSTSQGESIPSVCHAVLISNTK